MRNGVERRDRVMADMLGRRRGRVNRFERRDPSRLLFAPEPRMGQSVEDSRAR